MKIKQRNDPRWWGTILTKAGKKSLKNSGFTCLPDTSWALLPSQVIKFRCERKKNSLKFASLSKWGFVAQLIVASNKCLRAWVRIASNPGFLQASFCNAKLSVHLRRSFPCLIVFYVFVVLPEAQIPCQTFCRLHPELNTCNVDNLSPDLEEKHLAYQLGQLVQLLTKSNNKNISLSFEITIISRQHVYHSARSANNDFCSTFELCNLMKKTVMTKKINGENFSEENQHFQVGIPSYWARTNPFLTIRHLRVTSI